MTITSASLKLESCYRTRDGDAVKVVAFDGSRVIYVVAHGGIFPVWNRAMWRSMPKVEFAKEVISEISSR